MQCPYKGINVRFPLGALPMESGAVMKCPLGCPYMTVSQIAHSSRENGDGVRMRNELQYSLLMMKCPIWCSSNGEDPSFG